MKILVTFLMMFASSSAFAAKILDVRLDAENKHLLIDVAYTGGCGDHQFQLKMNDVCLETYPVQCSAQLLHKTNDSCEALLSGTVVVNLKKAGLVDPYFSEARLTIYDELRSATTVRLPKIN
jgi:hypothetical protein